ncbi:hypothetical protein [Arthrobacter sp. GAS37]|uniref:hypothetical protein n=1 Tax=Arthrobacter sp. GAS37 TaxID=3156261 RepID=UPI00384C0CBB
MASAAVLTGYVRRVSMSCQVFTRRYPLIRKRDDSGIRQCPGSPSPILHAALTHSPREDVQRILAKNQIQLKDLTAALEGYRSLTDREILTILPRSTPKPTTTGPDDWDPPIPHTLATGSGSGGKIVSLKGADERMTATRTTRNS